MRKGNGGGNLVAEKTGGRQNGGTTTPITRSRARVIAGDGADVVPLRRETLKATVRRKVKDIKPPNLEGVPKNLLEWNREGVWFSLSPGKSAGPIVEYDAQGEVSSIKYRGPRMPGMTSSFLMEESDEDLPTPKKKASQGNITTSNRFASLEEDDPDDAVDKSDHQSQFPSNLSPDRYEPSLSNLQWKDLEDTSKFRCTFCNRCFPQVQQFTYHVNNVHPDRDYCEFLLGTNLRLCDVCQQFCNGDRGLKKHKSQTHGKRVHGATGSISASSNKGLSKHTSQTRSRNRPDNTDAVSELSEHSNKDEPATHHMTKPSKKWKQDILCPVCDGPGNRMSNPTRYSIHIRTEHSDEPIEKFANQQMLLCTGCNVFCKGLNGLRRHQLASHKKGRICSNGLDGVVGHDKSPILVQPELEMTPISVDQAVHLVTTFGLKALDYVHHKWRKTLCQICLDLMGRFEGHQSLEAQTAFLTLPGLIKKMSSTRGEMQISKWLDKLRCYSGSNKIKFIINEANRLILAKSETSLRKRRNEAGQRPNIRKRALNLWMKGKIKRIREMVMETSSTTTRRHIDKEEHKEKIKSMFKECELDPALLLNGTETTTLIRLDPQTIMEEIAKLQTGKAKGISSWTNKAIKNIFYQSEYNQDLVGYCFSSFFNQILNGKLQRELWTCSRSVLIPKKDPNQFRPLGIGEAFFRLFGRMIVRYFAEGASEYFKPLQFGCGVKCGSEIEARLLDLRIKLDPKAHIVSLDMENAFTKVKRAAILEEIQRNAFKGLNELEKYFKWMYGGPNYLVNSAGENVLTIHEGILQGDPLSSLFFCLAIHPLLKELASDMKELHHTVSHRKRNKYTSRVCAYMDDINLVVDANKIEEAMHLAKVKFQEVGLEMNVSKTVIIAQGSEPYLGPYTSVGAAKILGIPIGKDVAEREKIYEGITSDLIKELDQLEVADIPTFMKFNIARSGINAALTYLDRVNEYGDGYEQYAIQLDERLDTYLLEIMGLTNIDERQRERFRIIRQLPQREGGLGIGKHCGWASEKQSFLSRLHTKHFIIENKEDVSELGKIDEVFQRNRFDHLFEEFHEGSNIGANWWNSDMMDQKKLFNFPAGKDSALTLDLANVLRVSQEATVQLYQAGREAVKLHLQTDKLEAWEAWWESVAYKGSGRPLIGMSDSLYGEYTIAKDEVYKASLALRILVDPAPSELESCILCGTNACTLHAMNCKEAAQGFWIQRHNEIRDMVFDLLKSKDIRPGGARKEEPMRQIHRDMTSIGLVTRETNEESVPQGNQIVADIDLRDHLSKYVIDVTISNPAAPSYARLHPGTTAGRVATEREKVKRAKYKEFCGRGTTFVPFVMEATGRFSEETREFLKLMIRNPVKRSSFAVKLAAKVMQMNCTMLKEVKLREMFTIYEEQARLKDSRHGIPERIITDLTQNEPDVSSALGGNSQG
jgi:hypothetical protein